MRRNRSSTTKTLAACGSPWVSTAASRRWRTSLGELLVRHEQALHAGRVRLEVRAGGLGVGTGVPRARRARRGRRGSRRRAGRRGRPRRRRAAASSVWRCTSTTRSSAASRSSGESNAPKAPAGRPWRKGWTASVNRSSRRSTMRPSAVGVGASTAARPPSCRARAAANEAVRRRKTPSSVSVSSLRCAVRSWTVRNRSSPARRRSPSSGGHRSRPARR